MSTKIENVVYRASWRDEISANLESVSFSTPTGVYTNYPEPPFEDIRLSPLRPLLAEKRAPFDFAQGGRCPGGDGRDAPPSIVRTAMQ